MVRKDNGNILICNNSGIGTVEYLKIIIRTDIQTVFSYPCMELSETRLKTVLECV